MSHQFGWMAPLDDGERGAVAYAEPGTMLDDGDSYLDATSPKRGVVLAMEGERVPDGGLYILRTAAPAALWDRLEAAAQGRL